MACTVFFCFFFWMEEAAVNLWFSPLRSLRVCVSLFCPIRNGNHGNFKKQKGRIRFDIVVVVNTALCAQHSMACFVEELCG